MREDGHTEKVKPNHSHLCSPAATSRKVTESAEVQLSANGTAELLSLSRPFVARLLEAGVIPSANRPGSSHRVVRLTDVLEFRQRRMRRTEGRRQIADALEDTDLPQ
jgi:hypothetical protein